MHSRPDVRALRTWNNESKRFSFSKLCFLFLEGDASPESVSRKICCCLCPNFAPLNRKARRHPKYKYCVLSSGAGKGTLATLQGIFTEYTTEKRGVQEAICYKHYQDVFRHKNTPSWSDEEIHTLNKRFKDAPKLRKAASSGSTPLSRSCRERLESPVYPQSNIPKKRQISDDVSSAVEEKLDRLKTPPEEKTKRA